MMPKYARYENALIVHMLTPDGTRLECVRGVTHGRNRPWKALTDAEANQVSRADICSVCVTERGKRSPKPAVIGEPLTDLQRQKLLLSGYSAADIATWDREQAASEISRLIIGAEQSRRAACKRGRGRIRGEDSPD